MSVSRKIPEFDLREAPSDLKTSYYNSGNSFLECIGRRASTHRAAVRGFDYLPITWQPGSRIGGKRSHSRGTAVSHEFAAEFCVQADSVRKNWSPMRDTMPFGFWYRKSSFWAMPNIREHAHVIRLEGIYWEFQHDQVWPVLMFWEISVWRSETIRENWCGKIHSTFTSDWACVAA